MIETLTNPDNILAAFVAIVVFATIVTLGAPLLGQTSLEGRLKSVANRREQLRRKSREALARGPSAGPGNTLRHTDEGMYKKVVDRLQLSKLLEDPQVVDKLAQAGFRGPRPVTTFYFFRLVAPIVMGAATAFYLYVVNDFGLATMAKICGCMFGVFIGYYAPNIYISNIAAKRRESIVAAFPDALDLLLICVEAGMSIEHAFRKVSTEIGGQSVPLAEEFALCTAELSYLTDRRIAYENLTMRTGLESVKSVSTALIQAERYGTPVGTALRTLAQESRDQRMNMAEKKAASLPPKLTVPMILFFLPVLFVIIMVPALTQVFKWQ